MFYLKQTIYILLSTLIISWLPLIVCNLTGSNFQLSLRFNRLDASPYNFLAKDFWRQIVKRFLKYSLSWLLKEITNFLLYITTIRKHKIIFVSNTTQNTTQTQHDMWKSNQHNSNTTIQLASIVWTKLLILFRSFLYALCKMNDLVLLYHPLWKSTIGSTQIRPDRL